MTPEDIAAVQKARAEVETQKRAVLDWMRNEGMNGHLRQNSDAPAWFNYEASVRDLDLLRSKHGL